MRVAAADAARLRAAIAFAAPLLLMLRAPFLPAAFHARYAITRAIRYARAIHMPRDTILP